METAQPGFSSETSSLQIASRTYNEAELIVALKNKDQNAFSYLYDHYAANMNAIIYGIINDKELCEDVLQEAFIKIWNNFENYDQSKGRLFTWMACLTKNLAIDFVRSGDYKFRCKTSFTDYPPAAVTNNSEIIKFDSLKIDKHILTLDADHVKLICLAYFSGMTQNEISISMEIPLGTVKTKMRKAILQLRKRLA